MKKHTNLVNRVSQAAGFGALTVLDAVVGVGCNLGDRLRTLKQAVARLGGLGEVRGVSLIYETAPVGPPQPDYLNAAVRLEFDGEPGALLKALIAIELEFGRVRLEKWGPRTLDLDILWIRDRVVHEADLVVPHPRMAERAFALLPLLDVAPDATHPVTGEPFIVPVYSTSDVRCLGPF